MLDPEPERYYDWMLWKLRQENDMESTVDIHKRDMQELTASYYAALARIKELSEENQRLKEQLKNYADIHISQ